MILVLLTSGLIHAQSNLLNANDPSKIGLKTQDQLKADNNNVPLAYGFIDDRDILWSKIVWEYID